MKLFIKNMVCDRCKWVVKNELEALQLHPTSIELGEVEISETQLASEQLMRLQLALQNHGFELIGDKKSRIIEKIKTLIIEMLAKSNTPHKVKLSDTLVEALHLDYHHLSHLFSTVAGITIEQYFINQRIEKVKELLVYDELSLTEIAHRYDYSSVAHLSSQFKKVTGLTPSHFKQLKVSRQRLPLDKI